WLVWLLSDRRPAVRVLGSWWLVLSVLTPFYHPYARLWLPMHAVAWLMMAGAVIALGPFSEEVRPSWGREVLTRPRLLASVAAALTCVVLARTHWRWEEY